MTDNKRRRYVPPEAESFTGPPVKKIEENCRRKNILHLAGVGPKPCRLMIVNTAINEDEAIDRFIPFGATEPVRTPPGMLKGPSGAMLVDLLRDSGFEPGSYYYTSLVKWLLPKGLRKKPTPHNIEYAGPAMRAEVEEVRPDFIVACGVPAYEFFCGPLTLRQSDILGGWFWSDWANAMVYVIEDLSLLTLRPERVPRLMIDFGEIRRKLEGVGIQNYRTNYQVVHDSNQLQQLVDFWQANQLKMISVDCEWHGANHVDGKLRSIQFCWAPGQAAYVRFMDDKLNYVFDQDYLTAGKILASWLDRPDVKYLGHHYAADAPWMHHVLGLEWYEKCFLDTEFAEQTIDENGEFGLERLALKYTALGRYDLPLVRYARRHKSVADGYGFIPDDILIPYACLRGESLVQLASGEWRKIRDLVKSKYSGKVKALLNGKIQDCRVTNWHMASVGQEEWYRIVTASTRSGRWGPRGPVFTPDHKVLTTRGRVRVDELKFGEDKILTDEPDFSVDQLRVILGSLLGDGGVMHRNDARCGLQFGQCARRASYVDWKADVLKTNLELTRVIHPGGKEGNVGYRSKYTRRLRDVVRRFPRKPKDEHGHRQLRVTRRLLQVLGPLGFAVWYQDDGVFTKDKECRIICRKLGAAEQAALVEHLVRYITGPGVHYDDKQGAVRMSVEASARFLDFVSPWMHDAFAYKSNIPVGSRLDEVDTVSPGVFAEVVESLHPVKNRVNTGDGVRYCLSVAKAENFLTEIGFVSNCKDVDTVFRAHGQIVHELVRQGLVDYYFGLFHPFVTDVFTSFALRGLPMDVERMDDLRTIFQWARGAMDAEFKQAVHKQARGLLCKKLQEKYGASGGLQMWAGMMNFLDAGEDDAYQDFCKRVLVNGESFETYDELLPWINHTVDSRNFNIRSPDQMRRWLFDICGFQPVKSTNQKEKGMPSMSWDRVAALPPEVQEKYRPSTDKETIKILAEEDQTGLLQQLLDLNAVGNLAKAFLKEPTKDKNGIVTRENGLHFWLSSDQRIHGQMSTTETGRPRSWKPNCLNWPSYVNDRIQDAIARLLKEQEEYLPPELKKFVGKKIPSIRSCVQAPEGWCFVESDYQTAEIRGLAYISGDEALIELMTGKDKQFALADVGGEIEPVRIRYMEHCDVDPANWDQSVLMTCKGKPVAWEQFLRDDQGKLVHPKYDLHWSLAEKVTQKPRELLNKKVDRGGLGKVGNFCLAEDSEVRTRDRGNVPIQDIRKDDLVWDGDDWVNHDGVVPRGVQTVYEYQGLWATPNHEVWVYNDAAAELGLGLGSDEPVMIDKVSFETAASLGWDLVPGDDPYVSAMDRYAWWVPGDDEQEDLFDRPSRKAETYDLLNAGPNHRFTCQGVLVSNSSAYGASGVSLERMIEAGTGVKPAPGTGDKILDALDARQPVAQNFLRHMETLPVNPGYYVAASGRIRRFAFFSQSVEDKIPWRLQQSIQSSLGRQARNFPMQESVAATAARAGKWLLDAYRREGLQAYPMIILYDSVVTCCPVEERFRVAQLHQEYMCDRNKWRYHGRDMVYPIDTEYLDRWSTKPDDETSRRLQDRSWKNNHAA